MPFTTSLTATPVRRKDAIIQQRGSLKIMTKGGKKGNARIEEKIKYNSSAYYWVTTASYSAPKCSWNFQENVPYDSS